MKKLSREEIWYANSERLRSWHGQAIQLKWPQSDSDGTIQLEPAVNADKVAVKVSQSGLGNAESEMANGYTRSDYLTEHGVGSVKEEDSDIGIRLSLDLSDEV
jgi:hypothetical protein